MWMDLIKENTNVQFFFLYNEPSLTEIKITGNDITFPNSETVYTIFHKTIGFFDYSLKQLEYTHLLRTNLSSFFKFSKLIENLQMLPFNNLVYSSDLCGKFPSGCGMVYSRDVIDKILQITKPTLFKKIKRARKYDNDDVKIGLIVNKLDIPIKRYKIHFEKKILTDRDYFHYRTRFENCHDLNMFNMLLKTKK
jgi:hypothetical protein